MTDTTPTTREQILLEAERDMLLEKIGYLDLDIATLTEGTIDGSLGGHDPDFAKLRGGLMKFWIEKAHKSPHPFAYCVRHLAKHVANPERLCAWLKDQALGTTKWRKGNKKLGEAAGWEPSVDELREALFAYEEAAAELGIEPKGTNGSGSSSNEGGSDDDTSSTGGDGGSSSSEGGSEVIVDPDAEDDLVRPVIEGE